MWVWFRAPIAPTIALIIERTTMTEDDGLKKKRVSIGISFCQVDRIRQIGHEAEAIT